LAWFQKLSREGCEGYEGRAFCLSFAFFVSFARSIPKRFGYTLSHQTVEDNELSGIDRLAFCCA